MSPQLAAATIRGTQVTLTFTRPFNASWEISNTRVLVHLHVVGVTGDPVAPEDYQDQILAAFQHASGGLGLSFSWFDAAILELRRTDESDPVITELALSILLLYGLVERLHAAGYAVKMAWE